MVLSGDVQQLFIVILWWILAAVPVLFITIFYAQ